MGNDLPKVMLPLRTRCLPTGAQSLDNSICRCCRWHVSCTRQSTLDARGEAALLEGQDLGYAMQEKEQTWDK